MSKPTRGQDRSMVWSVQRLCETADIGQRAVRP